MHLFLLTQNTYDQVLKLLQDKGAVATGPSVKRTATSSLIHLDSCSCPSSLAISQGGTCSTCGKPRVREIAYVFI